MRIASMTSTPLTLRRIAPGNRWRMVCCALLLALAPAARTEDLAQPETRGIVYEQTGAPAWRLPETPLRSGLPEEAAPGGDLPAAPTEGQPDPYDDAAWTSPDNDYPKIPSTDAAASQLDPAKAAQAPTLDPVMDALRTEYERGAGADAAPQRPGAPESAAASTDPPTTVEYLMRAFAGLLAICAAIIFLGYGVRKYGKHTPIMAGQHLGRHLGTVHLTPKAALHYVKSGDKVLVIGLTPTAITAIAEFPAAAFDAPREGASTDPVSEKTQAFFKQLREAAKGAKAETPSKPAEDDDIAALRGDVQRLQRHIEELGRERL